MSNKQLQYQYNTNIYALDKCTEMVSQFASISIECLSVVIDRGVCKISHGDANFFSPSIKFL